MSREQALSQRLASCLDTLLDVEKLITGGGREAFFARELTVIRQYKARAGAMPLTEDEVAAIERLTSDILAELSPADGAEPPHALQ